MAFIPFWLLPLDEYVGEPIHHFVRGGLYVCALTAGAVDARNDFNHSILPFD
jgi:hypothetical protein